MSWLDVINDEREIRREALEVFAVDQERRKANRRFAVLSVAGLLFAVCVFLWTLS